VTMTAIVSGRSASLRRIRCARYRSYSATVGVSAGRP
jgi:hypothetical protein